MSSNKSQFFPGLQCPAHWTLTEDKSDTWDTQEHRDKYHDGKQGQPRQNEQDYSFIKEIL
jgi:hypothetical protein